MKKNKNGSIYNLKKNKISIPKIENGLDNTTNKNKFNLYDQSNKDIKTDNIDGEEKSDNLKENTDSEVIENVTKETVIVNEEVIEVSDSLENKDENKLVENTTPNVVEEVIEKDNTKENKDKIDDTNSVETIDISKKKSSDKLIVESNNKSVKKDDKDKFDFKIFISSMFIKLKSILRALFLTNTIKGKDRLLRVADWFLKASFILMLIFLIVIKNISDSGVAFEKSKLNLPVDSIVYTKDGKEIGKISRKQANQIEVKYDDLSQTIVNSLVSTEDATFFTHKGFDILNTIESGYRSKIAKSSYSGGSSITQQIVGGSHYNRLLDSTVTRKIREIGMSIYAETQMSKTEIITDYLNYFHFGQDNIHGIQAASKYYFDKDASAMDMVQTSILVGTLNAPNLYNPLSGQSKDGVYYPSTRLSNIIYSNYNQGYIGKDEYTLLEQVKIQNTVKISPVNNKQKYQAYIDAVVSELQNDYKVDPFVTPLKIYTNMDIDLQNYANKINQGKVFAIPDQDLNYGFILTRTQTGEITAIGGGPQYNKNGAMLFNNATDTKVQPGSAFKPIIDYAPAFEYLHYSQKTSISNAAYKDPYSSHVFHNVDKKTGGSYTIDKALAFSRNLPALRTFTKVRTEIGDEAYIKYLAGLGFNFKETDMVTSAALGTKEVSPLEMAGAYQAFGNGGYYIKPHTIAYFEDLDGKKTEDMFKKEKAMDERTAFMMAVALENSTKTSGAYVSTASYYKTPYAAKTGTSNWGPEGAKYGIANGSQKDSWFVGFTSEYTMASWNAMNSEATKKGKIIQWGAEHDFSAYVWGALMKKAVNGKEYSYVYSNPPKGIAGGPYGYYYTD